MVEMENARLDHDQEVLRLKTQLQQLTATTKTSKSFSSINFLDVFVF